MQPANGHPSNFNPLLMMPGAPLPVAAVDEAKPEEDTLDRFERNGQPLQR